MTEVKLNEKETFMLKMVEEILNGGLSPEQASKKFDVSTRTVYRKISVYLKEGAGGLIHKSKGKKAHNVTSHEIIAECVKLYADAYEDYNFTHFHQKLKEIYGISISYPVLYNALVRAGFQSPKAHKSRKKPQIHPLRQRRECFGELVQLDASPHMWFGSMVTHLYLAIDDASGNIVSGWFEEQETLHGYYMLVFIMGCLFGIPEEFYTDKRTVFTSICNRNKRLSKQAGTQFQMAAARLGVLELHTTSVPQAKGRVERAFQTFQDRLVNELSSAHITTIEEANTFLPQFINDHNKRYAKDPAQFKNVFRHIDSQKELELALSVVDKRIVHSACITYKGQYYTPYGKEERKLIPNNTQVLVLKTIKDELYLMHGENTWPLINMKTNALPTPEDLVDKLYIPPKTHPWKETTYNAMINRLAPLHS